MGHPNHLPSECSICAMLERQAMARVRALMPTDTIPGPLVPTPPALDDKEAVAKATSPTGEPKVKPSAVKWWLAGTVGAVAGLELCAQQAPNPTVQLVCRVAAVALGAFIGAASPGFRKK